MIIGLLREEKLPPDRRVALLPDQCAEIQKRYPGIQVLVQPSPHRCVAETEYIAAGCHISEDMNQCDVLLGIKEVPVLSLLPGKTYFFFSHTIKKQKHNRRLLQAVLEKKITLIDYECLTDEAGQRLIAFGRYAGIVGTYNAFWTFGKKYGLYDLKRAYECRDQAEMETQYKKIGLPPIKIVLTGTGRVGKGALEVLQGMGIRQVSPDELLGLDFTQPVFAVLRSQDYHQHREGQPWDAAHFHGHPQQYISRFKAFTQVADILIATAYWHPQAPVLFTKEDMQKTSFRTRVVADVTCDIDGSIPCTIKSSSIPDPVYDYDRCTGETYPAFSDPDHISVMAIDNLPCELPLDASRYFAEQLIKNILPRLTQATDDTNGVLSRATIATGGGLTERYKYLDNFVKEGL